MKNFLLKMRNTVAYSCIGVVAIVFAINLVLFLKGLHTSAEMAYVAAKSATVINFAMVLLVVLSNVLLKADDDTQANFMALGGLGGVFTSLLWGGLMLLSGFFSGCFWMPVVYFVLTIYGATAIYCTTVHFVHKLRKIKVHYDHNGDYEFELH
ncbi:MAG: hypothetical protein NC218_11360 [Acetobacter sp.]|nr:hypothetical protein [Acetobacter sp.]